MVSKSSVIGVLAVVLLAGGCSSSNGEREAATAADQSSTESSAGDPTNPANPTGGGDKNAVGSTFIFPKTAQINAAFHGEYTFVGESADCEAAFSPGAQHCEWTRSSGATDDGVHRVVVGCDFKLPSKANPVPQDWVDESLVNNQGSIEVDDLPVPAIIDGADAPDTERVVLDTAFAVESQKPFTICEIGAYPIFDETTKVFRDIGLEETKAALVAIARESIESE